MDATQVKSILQWGFVTPIIESSMSLPEAVSTATAEVARHLLRSKGLRECLSNMPKGSGHLVPDSPIDELVKYVAIQRGQIDKSHPVQTLQFHELFIMPMFEFEREQVLKAVTDCKDITTAEWVMCCYGEGLGRLHNQLWAKWFMRVVSTYKSLDEDGKKQYEELAKGQLAQYDYTVFDFDPKRGCINRETWATAFPEEIQKIAEDLRGLIHDSDDEVMNQYFDSLYKAYTCTDVEQLETVWANVDWAWINIPNTSRIVPVHGMESGYEHPFCVSPEFRIEVRTEEARDLIEMRRVGTVEYAKAMRLSDELIDNASKKLERIDISVFTTAIRSGGNLVFRYAGQAVPNRQDVLVEGGKIFADRSAPINSTPLHIGYLEESCVPETFEALKGYITPLNMQVSTIDHEFAHPVGCTPESDEAIGGEVKKLLEEGKATFLGILADEWRESTPENRLTLVTLTVARLIRFMKKENLEDSTFAPYVRENLIAATTLFESGVMTLSKDGIVIHIEEAKSRRWFMHLNEFCTSLIGAYQSGDKKEIRRLTERYCDKDYEPIAKLIAWVNRKQ